MLNLVFWIRLLMVLVPLAITGCATNLNRHVESIDREVHNPDMKTMSEMNRPIVSDPAVINYVNDILRRLDEQLPEPCGCTVLVSSHSGFEALTLSSKTIVVSAGLLAQVETEDELAAIIAHELGHVVHAHSASGDLREGMLTLLRAGDVFAGGGYSLLFGDAAEAATSGLVYKNWEAEEEIAADQFAVGLLAKAGYSQEGLKMAIRRLASYSKEAMEQRKPRSECIGEANADGKRNIDATACAVALTNADRSVYLTGDERIKSIVPLIFDLPPEERRAPSVGSVRQFDSIDYLYKLNRLDYADEANLRAAVAEIERLNVPPTIAANDTLANEMFMAHVMLGHQEKAMEYLLKSFDSDHRTVGTLRNMMEVADHREDRELVKQVLAEARSEIGWSGLLLPYEAYLAKRYGIEFAQVETTARCLGNLAKDTEIYNRCAEYTKLAEQGRKLEWR